MGDLRQGTSNVWPGLSGEIPNSLQAANLQAGRARQAVAGGADHHGLQLRILALELFHLYLNPKSM